MSISSGSSRMANLHLQRVEREDWCDQFGEDFEKCLEAWRDRDDPGEPNPELLQHENIAYFCIDRDGRSWDYWPDEDDCDLSESLFREFSEDDRVWETGEPEPMCVRLTYHVLNEQESIAQLLLPYFEAGEDKPSGFVVVSERY